MSVMNFCLLFSVTVIAFVFDSKAAVVVPEPNSSDSVLSIDKEHYTVAALNSADGVYLILNDGPIVLRNCRHYDFLKLRIKLYDFVYHPVQTPQSSFNGYGTEVDCSISKIYLRNFFFPKKALPTRIQLEAIVEEGETEMSVSTVLAVIGEFEEDLDNPLFVADGVEYVVLNYKLYRAFLVLVLVTGVLIVLLEIRDIMAKYRRMQCVGAYGRIYYI